MNKKLVVMILFLVIALSMMATQYSVVGEVFSSSS